jgi:hypothetical protein
MVEDQKNYNEKSIIDQFHAQEKKIHSYDDYQDCTDESYFGTLDALKKLVERVQRDGVFSANEELKEIETDHLRLLLLPYYKAQVLCRIMENRDESVKLGLTFYMEYLKLMKHYGVLDDTQKLLFKAVLLKEEEGIDKRAVPFMDREVKIKALREKKALEKALDVSLSVFTM